MTRSPFRRIAALMFAAFVLMGQRGCVTDISISDIITGHTAKITAVNGANGPAYVILYADDAYVTGWLAAHTSTGIETHVEGQYTVIFRYFGIPGSADTFKATLQQLRQDTTRLHDSPSDETTEALKSRILHTKAELDQLRRSTTNVAAQCSGSVAFPADVEEAAEPIRIVASLSETVSSDPSTPLWTAYCP